MRILISGAHGFVGRPLTSFLLSQNHQLTYLSRTKGPDTIIWNEVSPELLEGFDAVIHLAGEALSITRWSEQKRKRIYSSRVETTSRLVDTLAQTKKPPGVFISASAIGFYGNRGSVELSESSSKGNSFLADVCEAWEEASKRLTSSRVIHARFGMILGDGGALSKMLPIYKLGMGAILGTGEQWLSFIDLKDLIRGLDFVLNCNNIEGPVNFVSPQPIQQKDFSQCLARVLRRPHFLKIPQWILRLLLGVVADEVLLSSSRVIPSKLLALKFSFEYSELENSLKRIFLEK